MEGTRQIDKAGWTVIAGARNEQLGKEAVAKLRAEGLDVHFIYIDLTAHESGTAAAGSIRRQFGKLDVLINNAGIASKLDGPPSKVEIEAVETVMRTNFAGTVPVTQAVLQLFQTAGKA